jgi:hypothetical protein
VGNPLPAGQSDPKEEGESSMIKRILFSVLAIFIAWSILDFLLHRLLLRSTYEANAGLWRPENDLNIPLIYLVIFVLIISFVLFYRFLIDQKSLASGIRFGAIFGLFIGVSVGFGTYIHMPIPLILAWSWFLGGWIKAVTAGAIVGALIKQKT